MFERLARSTREALGYAADEAARRGERRVGTEHLLLGLLYDPAGPAPGLLGTDLAGARDALDALDRAALAAVGIDVTGLAPQVAGRRGHGRVRFTASAGDVLRRTLRVAGARGSTRLEPEHLLVALLDCAGTDPVAQLLARLDVDVDAVRARLADAA